MAQFMRPIQDITRDNWFDEAGGTANLFGHIDETSVNDADYVKSQLSPTNDVYVFKLSPVTDPGVSIGHIARIRFGKDAAGGDTIDLRAELRQGYANESSQGTLIAEASSGNIPAGWTDFVFELAGTTADLITNYSDLYIRIIANKA